MAMLRAPKANCGPAPERREGHLVPSLAAGRELNSGRLFTVAIGSLSHHRRWVITVSSLCSGVAPQSTRAWQARWWPTTGAAVPSRGREFPPFAESTPPSVSASSRSPI